MAAGGGDGIRVHAQNCRIREQGLQLLLDLLRAAADGLHRAAAFGAARVRGLGVAAVVAHQAAARGVIGQVDAAARALRHVAAVHADEEAAVAAAVEEEDGLLAVQDGVADALFELAAEIQIVPGAQLLLHIDEARSRKGAAIIAGFQRVEGIDAGLREIHGLDRRRGGAEQDERARLGPAVKGDLPRVIARGVFGFIGVLLLLIEDEKPGRLQGRKDRRARADHDSGLAPGDAPPLVVAFADAQARVEHGDGLAEVRGHAAEQLRGQGDLRHQEHGGAALVQRFLDERDVDGGLAAAGHAVEQGRAGLFALHLGG